ncbi:hypothetical protein, partial [Klebsiella pneumoniae]|uniref:hypothetical protein n=1 Tax=Klebsiella pneumoniae TaxID=573 RepID=UPI0025A30647
RGREVVALVALGLGAADGLSKMVYVTPPAVGALGGVGLARTLRHAPLHTPRLRSMWMAQGAGRSASGKGKAPVKPPPIDVQVLRLQ